MKRISPATVTFGVMAVVLGLVAAYIVKQALHKPEIAKPAPPAAARFPPTRPGAYKSNLPRKMNRLRPDRVFGLSNHCFVRPAGTKQSRFGTKPFSAPEKTSRNRRWLLLPQRNDGPAEAHDRGQS